MSTVGPDFLANIISAGWETFVLNCCTSAATALVFYDHITTLSTEVNLIWARKLSSVTLLFHLNRWTIFVWAVIGPTTFLTESTLSSCMGYSIFTCTVNIVLFVIWAVFSALRVYAIGGGNLWLTATVSVLSLVPAVTNSYFYYAKTFYEMEFVEGVGLVCVTGPNLSAATFTKLTIGTEVCVAAAELLVLLVTWFKTYYLTVHARNAEMSTPITSKLLRDGTTYFTLLLILSIVNIVGVDTNVFSSAAALFKIPISSIVISHFLLDLRQLASFPEDKTTTRGSQYVTLQFASFVDNMGESLEHNSDYSRGEFMEVDKNDDITGDV